jgi:hypothetical protein
MPMNARMLSFGLALCVMLLVIELVRRERLTFKYAMGWLLTALAGMSGAVFDGILHGLSGAFGFELTSNFIFFVLLCGFIFLSLMLTVFLCQQNDRNDKMARRLALLEFEVQRHLEAKAGEAGSGGKEGHARP